MNTPTQSSNDPTRPEGNIPSGSWAAVKARHELPYILRLPKMKEVLQMSRSTLYGMMDPRSSQFDPDFPKPIRLGVSASGRGSVGWLGHEVEAYIELCVMRSREVANRARAQASCMGAYK